MFFPSAEKLYPSFFYIIVIEAFERLDFGLSIQINYKFIVFSTRGSNDEALIIGEKQTK